MSVKTKLARQAVRSTAKHTAHGAAARFTRKPLRAITLLSLGAAVGGLVGWLVGRSGGGADAPFEPVVQAPEPLKVATDNSAETQPETSETGAAS